jgi:hypothetical protein
VIIDAHAHLGFDEVFDEDFTEAALLESQERNGIELTLVQPAIAHELATVRRYHDAIADLTARHPGRFRGIANPNPHLGDGAWEKEVGRCVTGLGFAGVKLHPAAHAVNPLGRHGRRVFETCAALKVPVIVHTGSGIPWAAPSLLAPAAKAHPGMAIVVAHSGMMVLAGEAARLAADCPNVYLEVSWTGGFLVREWAREFGARRLLFGSDHADNAATELAKIRTAGLTDEETGWILGGTAAKVFGVGA